MAGKRPKGLVPVHAEAGAVQFQYNKAYGVLGGGLGSSSTGSGGGAAPAAAAPQPLAVADERPLPPEKLPPPLLDGLDDFISLDAGDARDQQPPAAAAPAAAAAAAQAGGGGGGVAAALLDDYISLGILDDPAAAAAGKAAAAAAGKAAAQAGGGGHAAPPDVLDRVPWLAALKGIRSPLLRLHQEIVEFCRYLAPSPAEAAARQAAIDRIEDVVTSIWPKARVQVFGSFATGLYLPTSDVDAVVMGSGCADVPQGLKALATALARKNMAKNMQVIAKAKVPIVKFEDAETGYNFDLSFDVANGPEAAENVRALMDALPPMRPLVMVLKVFLQQRELNEVYSGGLGSYALLVMVAAFLQLHPSRQPPASTHRYGSGKGGGGGGAGELESSLGVLLLDFLRLYGRALNNIETGVSCRQGGFYFSKRAKGFFQPERPFLFAVEDPNDPDNDLGRNSYNISRVRMAFDWAYCQLTAPADPGASLLQRIIRLDPVLFERAPPPHDDASPPPSGKKKRQRHKEKRRAAAEAAAAEGGGEEEGAGRGRQREQPRAKKRRHRERSMSDSDMEMSEEGAAAAAEVEPSSSEEEGRRHHKRHKQRHHHHHHHHRHGRHHQQQRHEHHAGGGGGKHRHRHSSGGGQRQGGGRHVYFD